MALYLLLAINHFQCKPHCILWCVIPALPSTGTDGVTSLPLPSLVRSTPGPQLMQHQDIALVQFITKASALSSRTKELLHFIPETRPRWFYELLLSRNWQIKVSPNFFPSKVKFPSKRDPHPLLLLVNSSKSNHIVIKP